MIVLTMMKVNARLTSSSSGRCRVEPKNDTKKSDSVTLKSRNMVLCMKTASSWGLHFTTHTMPSPHWLGTVQQRWLSGIFPVSALRGITNTKCQSLTGSVTMSNYRVAQRVHFYLHLLSYSTVLCNAVLADYNRLSSHFPVLCGENTIAGFYLIILLK